MGCASSSPAAADAPAAVDTVTIPLGVVSSFNEGYNCTVQSATLTKSALSLTLSVAGDGSLGPLQGAASSSLMVGNSSSQPSMTQEFPGNGDNVWNGTLYYPRAGDGAVFLAAGAPVSFSFGAGGYSEVRTNVHSSVTAR